MSDTSVRPLESSNVSRHASLVFPNEVTNTSNMIENRPGSSIHSTGDITPRGLCRASIEIEPPENRSGSSIHSSGDITPGGLCTASIDIECTENIPGSSIHSTGDITPGGLCRASIDIEPTENNMSEENNLNNKNQGNDFSNASCASDQSPLNQTAHSLLPVESNDQIESVAMKLEINKTKNINDIINFNRINDEINREIQQQINSDKIITSSGVEMKTVSDIHSFSRNKNDDIPHQQLKSMKCSADVNDLTFEDILSGELERKNICDSINKRNRNELGKISESVCCNESLNMFLPSDTSNIIDLMTHSTADRFDVPNCAIITKCTSTDDTTNRETPTIFGGDTNINQKNSCIGICESEVQPNMESNDYINSSCESYCSLDNSLVIPDNIHYTWREETNERFKDLKCASSENDRSDNEIPHKFENISLPNKTEHIATNNSSTASPSTSETIPVYHSLVTEEQNIQEQNTIFSVKQETSTNIKNYSIENYKFFQQSPTTLSRSSSVSKRSLSSSSISPRSPRISQCDDDVSLSELCKEAESIRQYIDSEFLSNLLIKGEKEKARNRKKSEKNLDLKSDQSIEISGSSSNTKNETTDNDEVSNTNNEMNILNEMYEAKSENLVMSESLVMSENKHSFLTTSSYDLKDENIFPVSVNSRLCSECTTEITEHDGIDLRESNVMNVHYSSNFTKTIIKVDGSEITADNRPTMLPLNITILKSDLNSPQFDNITEQKYSPVTNIFSLNTNYLDLMQISSPSASPVPSPTFTRSSFALNSQFLRSLSASTQELLNSLVVSSSVDINKPHSPIYGISESAKYTSDAGEIKLALPTLAPSTSIAICKLFSAAEKLTDESIKSNMKIIPQLETPDTDEIMDNSCLTWISGQSSFNKSVHETESPIQIENTHMPSVTRPRYYDEINESSFRPISPDHLDADILRQERVLDNILAPGKEDAREMEFNPSHSIQYENECYYREVPTLQELASASLPSSRPVSTAIISFPSFEEQSHSIEKTHLNRRYNSPEYRKTPSPRLSLRDKFERDLHSTSRHKHSKSLSKNARFQKGPNSRVNSQEKKEKTVSKLDKSKSESRIGDNFEDDRQECPLEERVKSEGCLESKRHTTVKFAPLNIEIPNDRQIELEDPVIEDERLSDMDDIISPSDEVTAEMIRKRLWAGLRSFSVDADILQAYGILISTSDTDQDKLMNNLAECTIPENEAVVMKSYECPQRKTSMTAEDLEFLEARRKKRRGSVAALQELVKENTQIINRFVKQKKLLENEIKKSTSEESDAKESNAQFSLIESENNVNDKCDLEDDTIDDTITESNSNSPSYYAEKNNNKDRDKIIYNTNRETESTVEDKIKPTTSKKPISQRSLSDASITSGEHLNFLAIQTSDEKLFTRRSKSAYEKDFNTIVDINQPSIFDRINCLSIRGDRKVTTHIAECNADGNGTVKTDQSRDSTMDIRETIVTHQEGNYDDSSCFKLPLSAFCVSGSKRNVFITENEAVLPIDHDAIVTQSGVLGFSKLIHSTHFLSLDSSQSESSTFSYLSEVVHDDSESRINSCSQLPSSDSSTDTGPTEIFSLNGDQESPTKCQLVKYTTDGQPISQDYIVEKASSSVSEQNSSCSVPTQKPKFSVPTQKIKSPHDSTENSIFNVSDKLLTSLNSSPTLESSDNNSDITKLQNTSLPKIWSTLKGSTLKSPSETSGSKIKLSPTDKYSRTTVSPQTEMNTVQCADHLSRPITFNPFPTRSSYQKNKEIPLKLGLYTSQQK